MVSFAFDLSQKSYGSRGMKILFHGVFLFAQAIDRCCTGLLHANGIRYGGSRLSRN